MTNMLRIRIDLARMHKSLKTHRLPPNASDDGYRVHAYLQEVFDGAAPTPFRVLEAQGRALDVLAYGSQSLSAGNGVDVAMKAMPNDFQTGSLFRFSLVACPVVRMASAGPHHKKGAEIDVFLRDCWKSGAQESLNRSEVYSSWLGQRFESQGGAELLSSQVTGYRRTRLLRKTQARDRRSHQADKPAVDFEGTIRVRDSSLFSSLLARGIGRHRAFGFGMLLIKRSGVC